MLVASAMRSQDAGASASTPIMPSSTPQVDTTVAATAAPPAAVQPSAERADAVSAPKWSATANPRKAGYGARMVFELAADADIDVWRKRVRPVLTVRCAARATEVFVVTDSPAAIEDNSNRHTIELGFDGQEPREQHWEHSIDHDALFAPNGRAIVRQMASAKTMTFRFAPFNAPPATVTFSVDGFDTHHKTALRMCGGA
jgi:hypothetical protein